MVGVGEGRGGDRRVETWEKGGGVGGRAMEGVRISKVFARRDVHFLKKFMKNLPKLL